MKKYLLYILCALTLCSCIYPYSTKFPEDAPSRLVVSGDIFPGEETRIYLGYVFPLGTATGTMRKTVPTGNVTVENDRGQRFQGRRKAGGLYVLDTRKAPVDASYRLMIVLSDGRVFCSPWSIVYKAPEITDLSYATDSDKVYLKISLKGDEAVRHFRWDYTETWEYHAWFRPELMYVPGLPVPDRENPSKIYRERNSDDEDFYYCWNSAENVEPCLATTEDLSDNIVEGNVFHTMSRADAKVSTMYSILVTVCGMSKGAYAYLNHQSAVSNMTGDLFSPTPSEMSGNLVCIDDADDVAIGYVNVTTRNTKRIFVSGVYYSTFDPNTLLFIPEADEDGNHNFEQLFSSNSPVRGGNPLTVNNVYWGPKRCTDCRAWGGSKNKPDWWPTDHE